MIGSDVVSDVDCVDDGDYGSVSYTETEKKNLFQKIENETETKTKTAA